MFTIEVEKRGKDDEFKFKDLKMFHHECYGGTIKCDYQGGYWELSCQRCGLETAVHITYRSGVGREDSEETINIIKTAIDGRERNISDDVRVIQKN